jgi:hypothetical protein
VEISSARSSHRKASFPHQYVSYGQTIGAEFALPELASSEPARDESEEVDLEVIPGTIPGIDDLDGVNGVARATETEVLLHYDHSGGFLVRNGRRIVVGASVDPSQRLARHLIIGVCMGLALHQKGHLTLHASAVGLEEGVAAFIGWKRRGKSTTASALCAIGGRLVTDDIVAVPPGEDATVLPGFPQMRLDPEAVAATLDTAPEDLPRLHEDHQKRIGRADQRFQREPRPLRCVYVLEWGDDFGAEPLSPRDAFVQLLQHSYAQRFLGQAAATPSHFAKVKDLVEAVPMVRLERPRALDRLPEMVRFVRSHFRSL